MTKLVAVHEIIRRNAQGKREAIAPGTRFEASEAEVQFYTGCGAAAPAKEAPAVQAEPAGGPAERDLSKLKKPELVEIAKELEIEGCGDMTVAQLIEAITAAEAKDADEDSVI